MKKRVILGIALILLIGAGMPASASDYTWEQNEPVYGSLSTGTCMVSAGTKNLKGGASHVTVMVHYISPSGGIYWSSPFGKSSESSAVSLSRNVDGEVIGAVSAHGTDENNIEFVLQMGE